MKKSIAILTAALALSACNQQPYAQPYQTTQGCDPRYNDCYGHGVGYDHYGNAILAGGAGLAAGYALGRHSQHNNYGGGYGYHQPQTVVVHHYYHASAPTYSAPTPSYSSASSSFSRPAARTMFGSARRR